MNDLIKLALDSIEENFGKTLVISNIIKEKYSKKCGAFVTITINNELRGCIGFIESDSPLYKTIIEAAKHAAFSDPRFEPLSKEEFEEIDIEISILNPPQKINSTNIESIKKEIIVGKHGLIIKKGYKSGLLLPQVATEYNWNVEEFLKHTCLKAGLSPTTWKSEKKDFELYKFDVEIISK